MKSFRFAIFLLVFGFPFALWGSDREEVSPSLPPLYGAGAAAEARMILVLHKGRGNSTEVMSGSRMMMYRPRGYDADTTWNRSAARTIAKSHGLTYLADWWMTEVDLNCVVMLIPEDRDVDRVIGELLADNQVLTAQKMSTFNTMSNSYNDPYFDLQESASYFDLANIHGHATGKNVRIAVIDTGVEYQHPDLDGQIVDRENFVLGISPEFSDDIHGTAVAGVIVAKPGNELGIVGIAPDSKVVALKACWPVKQNSVEAVCNSFTLALAINKALALDVDIINLSLSGPPDKVIALLIEEALRRGVIVVAATNNAKGDETSFPASLSGVVAVAESAAAGSGENSYQVSVPSQKIITTVPRGKYNFISGTSLGAAQVSGYVALLKELYPQSSDKEIKFKLGELNAVHH